MTHPLDVLTRTNIPPTQAEGQSLTAILLDEDEYLSGLGGDALAAVRDQMDAYRRILAPARRVPPEIVAMIFRYCIPAGTTEFPPNPAEAPLLLTHICSAWRKVAHTTPQLWTVISCNISQQKALDALEAFSQTWHDRASPLPSTLHVTLPKVVPERIGEGFWSAMRQSRKLLIATEDTSSLDSFLAPVRGALDALEDLTLQLLRSVDHEAGPGESFVAALEFDIHAFEFSQRLRRFEFIPGKRCVSFITLNDSRFPWAQLTELSFDDTYVMISEALDILQECRRLEIVFLALATLRDVDEIIPITLRRLRILQIAIRGPGNIAGFFNSLTLPALEAFGITPDSRSYPTYKWPAAAFNTLLTRSSPPIIYLGLYDLFEQNTDFRDLLSHVPELTALVVLTSSTESDFISSTVLPALTPYGSAPPLTPRLEYLHMITMESISPQALASMLALRWWPDVDDKRMVARLRKLTARVDTRANVTELRLVLDSCAAQGLDVTVTSAEERSANV